MFTLEDAIDVTHLAYVKSNGNLNPKLHSCGEISSPFERVILLAEEANNVNLQPCEILLDSCEHC